MRGSAVCPRWPRRRFVARQAVRSAPASDDALAKECQSAGAGELGAALVVAGTFAAVESVSGRINVDRNVAMGGLDGFDIAYADMLVLLAEVQDGRHLRGLVPH